MGRTVHKDKLSIFYEKMRERGAKCDEKFRYIFFKISENEVEVWGLLLREGSEDIYEVLWGSTFRWGSGALRTGHTMAHVIDEVLKEI